MGVDKEDRAMVEKGLKTVTDAMTRLDELEEMDELPRESLKQLL